MPFLKGVFGAVYFQLAVAAQSAAENNQGLMYILCLIFAGILGIFLFRGK